MSSCPKCHFDLSDQDFGLIVCPGCGISLMIDMDGSVESSQEVEPMNRDENESEEPTHAQLSDQILSDLEEPDSASSDSDDWHIGEGEDGEQEPVFDQDAGTGTYGYDLNEASDIGEETGVGAEADFIDSAEEASPDLHDDVPSTNLDESLVSEAASSSVSSLEDEPDVVEKDHYDGDYESADEVYAPATEASVDEISEYANSDLSQKGAIRYKVRIGHIDSGEIREEVRDVLADKRLMLDADQVMAGIEDGQLELLDLPAVKAYVILSQLIGIAVALSWTQQVEANP